MVQYRGPTTPKAKASCQDMEAIAKFDFMASGEDELSFHTGDILKVGDAGTQGTEKGLRLIPLCPAVPLCPLITIVLCPPPPPQILSNQEEWLKAELGSQEGYVPKNFIDIQFPE
ncbi:hypothetical protein U0070_020729 [Myodes glareolus]|uniref:SH3 domain-containing protein n=1 Tax=Myodes glareolus TaxID=447135 RepID=A0AAW0HNZ4_MYOGA